MTVKVSVFIATSLDGFIHLMREGLMDEMTIGTIPVQTGEGLPSFDPLNRDVKLELLASRSSPSGFVRNKYRISS